MEDVSKLPKWAQKRITQLEGRIAHQAKLLDELAGVATEAPGTVSYTSHTSPARPIPVQYPVTFHFEPWFGTPSYISARLVGDHVSILGSRGVKIVPWASNHIHVELEERS